MLGILAWIMHPPGYTPEGFVRERIADSRNSGKSTSNSVYPDASFWYINSYGDARLKPSVAALLQELRIQCTCQEGLYEVLVCIRKLLQANPEKRLNSRTLVRYLKQILLEETERTRGRSRFLRISSKKERETTSEWQLSLLPDFLRALGIGIRWQQRC